MPFNPSAKGPGDVYQTVAYKLYNRTGATMEKGQIGLLDLSATQAESTSLVPGNSAYRFGNVTPCTQPKLDFGHPAVVCLEEGGVADNAEGLFGFYGVFDVAILDDDVSTTDIDVGEPILVLVTESAVAGQAWVTGAPSGGTSPRTLGIALEAAAADSDDTDRKIDASSHRRTCLWTGGLPASAVTDT